MALAHGTLPAGLCEFAPRRCDEPWRDHYGGLDRRMGGVWGGSFFGCL